MNRHEKIDLELPEQQFTKLLSERLRVARAGQGLSQRQLGRRAGIQPSSIAHFETGPRKPTIASLRRLSAALHVTTDYLLGIVDDPGIAAPHDSVRQDIDRLTGSDRELAKEILRMLVERSPSSPSVSG